MQICRILHKNENRLNARQLLCAVKARQLLCAVTARQLLCAVTARQLLCTVTAYKERRQPFVRQQPFVPYKCIFID